MKRAIILVGLLAMLTTSCLKEKKEQLIQSDQSALATFFADYQAQYLAFFPLEATQQGVDIHNGTLGNTLTASHRDSLISFFQTTLQKLAVFEQKSLSNKERWQVETLRFTVESALKQASIPFHEIPFNHMEGVPWTLASWADGKGPQPLNSPEDHKKWINRLQGFQAWSDTAIACFRSGMGNEHVLPKPIVIKMISQLRDILATDPTQSIFYQPVVQLPATLDEVTKEELETEYLQIISQVLQPSYGKLADFLETEYLPVARETSGLAGMPGGKRQYDFWVSYWTTTQLTPEEIYKIGVSEVVRIQKDLDSMQRKVGFNGSRAEFFNHLATNRKFFPFQKPEQVIGVFQQTQQKVQSKMNELFSQMPQSVLEIRQTEAFREKTASAEYVPGHAPSKRPGIFYIPIPNAAEYNVTSGMEALFLHEGIPGHHFQVSLQQENNRLPAFMRYGWIGAFGEGWALYSESLGEELGLYEDPYQKIGALKEELHRAIRLVVDVGLHRKGWTREKAIQYMQAQEPITQAEAEREVERYMVLPGQALSYKIGALTILELRKKYESSLGERFSLISFHDELLSDGCLPLSVVSKKMDIWAKKQGRKELE